jgi:hypothetical protein
MVRTRQVLSCVISNFAQRNPLLELPMQRFLRYVLTEDVSLATNDNEDHWPRRGFFNPQPPPGG